MHFAESNFHDFNDTSRQYSQNRYNSLSFFITFLFHNIQILYREVARLSPTGLKFNFTAAGCVISSTDMQICFAKCV